MRQKSGNPDKPSGEGDSSPDKTSADVGLAKVVVYKRKSGKKRGSSRASRRLEDVESRASKSVHRVTKAVNRGVKTYLDKRDKSERKRRDGALVDFYENASVGAAEAIANSSPVLTDIAKAWNTRKLRKRIRKVLRGIPVIG